MSLIKGKSQITIEKTQKFGRTGYLAAILTAALAASSLGVAITTPPRSGPFAAPENLIPYPYSGAGKYVPRDFIWMYPALLMMLFYVILFVCLQRRSVGAGRVYGTVGSTLAAVSFGIIGVDYFIQLRTVQPSLLRGETDGLAIISQYNPHGVFIALEELGFLVMGISFGFIAFALGSSKLERISRRVFLMSAIVIVVAFVGMSLSFGMSLEYRFEVTAIFFAWLTLITTGVLLALDFGRESKRE
ncbi:MAG: hypothetical protein Q8K48_00205 [Candidatus Planktophila sp.]|nr:hypothetical protein [Candidatus Planktophila sp.]